MIRYLLKAINHPFSIKKSVEQLAYHESRKKMLPNFCNFQIYVKTTKALIRRFQSKILLKSINPKNSNKSKLAKLKLFQAEFQQYVNMEKQLLLTYAKDIINFK
jgi:hypothetical protein